MKTKILLILLLVSSFAFAQIPFNGLQAMYEFTGGALTDDANGNNFTQTGTALTTENDRLLNANNAISLNGDYLTRSDIDFGGTTTNFDLTWSFWVKTTTNTADRKTIIDDSSRNTIPHFDSDDVGYYIFLKDGKIAFESRYYEKFFNSPVQPASYGHEFPAVIADGNWHHIVILFNPVVITGNQYIRSKIYVDGVENAKNINGRPIFTSPNANGNITIGNSRYNHLPAINKYTDSIDDIYAYNRELSQTEIEQLIGNYCFAPNSNLISATNITQTSADINMTGSGTYDLAYHKASEPFSSAVILPNVSATTNLSGLDVFTEYLVYLREQCVIPTAWSSSVLFKTERPLGRVYVNAAAIGTNNGLDWANAYNSLTNALALVQPNEEIWVAQGTYKPDATNRTITFIIPQNGVKLYGGFNGTETNLTDRDFRNNTTILSGDLLGNDNSVLEFVNATRNDNAYNVITVVGNNTTIDGFTISDAHANGATQKSGGAIFKSFTVANLDIYNCIIKNNVAWEAAAGVFARYEANGTLKVHQTIFENNLANHGSAIYSYTGVNFTANFEVVNSLFHGNVAKDNGAAKGYAGSAGWFRAVESGSTMNCKLINNTYSGNQDLGTATGLNNFSRATVGFAYSNGAFVGEVSNCVFWGNTAAGGATAKSITGIITNLGQNIMVNNSIGQDGFSSIPAGSLTNTMNANPMFIDASNKDFTLNSGSPAIDSGNNAKVLAGMTTDLLGYDRIFNNTVDMGPYEYGATLGMDNFEMGKSDIKLYPNPAHSILNIKSNSVVKQVSVFNVQGQKVLESTSSQINISKLSNGMYLIKIQDANGVETTKRFVKY